MYWNVAAFITYTCCIPGAVYNNENLQINIKLTGYMCSAQKSRFDNHAVTDTLSTFWCHVPWQINVKNKVDLHTIGIRLGVIEY